MTQETSDGVPISGGFDYPVGPRGDNVDVFKTHKVDTILVDEDYFKSLGYWHPGEDWNGRGGGDTDLGDPIYAISNGKVTDFGHYSVWGNVVLLEHALPDGNRVWSQYAHLDKIMVNKKGQKVKRGDQIGTMGKGDNNRYLAHLHFEIRKKNLPITNWSPMVKDKNAVLANYYSPMDFIKSHRPGMLAQPAAPAQPETTPTTQPAATPQPTPQIQQIVVTAQQTDPKVGTFRASQNNPWNKASGGFKGGELLWVPATTQQETHWAEWHPAIAASGLWEVWVYIPENNATTSYARYQIVHLDGTAKVPVNQGGNSNQWLVLGVFRFSPGKGYVRLGNATGEITQGAYAVGFDAVCWNRAT